MKRIPLFLIALFFIQNSVAQSPHFPLRSEASPLSRVEQVLGIDTLSLEFSRPVLNGRTLFGEMIPWGTVWRTGANASTKITFSEQMIINGNKVPKGKYSLLSIPNKDKWTIILNTNTSLWGHYGYKKEEDLLRFEVVPTTTSEFSETFNIILSNTTKFQTNMDLVWGNLKVPMLIEVDKQIADRKIMASIDEKLNDPEAHKEDIISAHIYFFAADYYFQTNRDLNQAITWMNKAIEIKEVNYFYFYQSKILGEMGRFKQAIEASQNGLALFQKGTNEEWKWRYREQIEQWRSRLD